jgi:hypothetical protein
MPQQLGYGDHPCETITITTLINLFYASPSYLYA